MGFLSERPPRRDSASSSSFFRSRRPSRDGSDEETRSNFVEYVSQYGLPWPWLRDYLKQRFPNVDMATVRSDNAVMNDKYILSIPEPLNRIDRQRIALLSKISDQAQAEKFLDEIRNINRAREEAKTRSSTAEGASDSAMGRQPQKKKNVV